jgi:hypothetical protein
MARNSPQRVRTNWHGQEPEEYRRLAERCRETARNVSAATFFNPISSLWRRVGLHIRQDSVEKLVERPGLLSKLEGIPWTDPVCITGVRGYISGLAKFMRTDLPYRHRCISFFAFL